MRIFKTVFFAFLILFLSFSVWARDFYFEKGDITGNGLADIIIIVPQESVKIYFNNGNFKFEGPAQVYADNKPLILKENEVLKLEDLNKNGKNDIIIKTDNGVSIYENAVMGLNPVFKPVSFLSLLKDAAPRVSLEDEQLSLKIQDAHKSEVRRIRPDDILLPRPETRSVKNEIIFLDFKFMNPEINESSWLTTGIPDFIYFFVPENIDLKLIPRGEVKGKNIAMSNVATAFQEVKYVVTGEFSIEGDDLIIKMSVIDMDSVNVVLEKEAKGQRDNVYPVIEELGEIIRDFFESRDGENV